MKFKKKPIVIDAFQWTGDITQKEDPEWIVEAIKKGDVEFVNTGTEDCYMKIATLEGMMTASLGDYIICGIKGEIYPCKPEIFELTYELDKEDTMTTAEMHDEINYLNNKLTAIREALISESDIERIVHDDAEGFDWNDLGSKALYIETRIIQWKKDNIRIQNILDK